MRNIRPKALLGSLLLVLLMLTTRGGHSGSPTATPAATPIDRPKPAKAAIIATYTLPDTPLGPF